jgi:gluconokinase
MPSSLLKSQFDTLEPLEPDENGVALDVGVDVDAIVDAYLARTGPNGTTGSVSP